MAIQQVTVPYREGYNFGVGADSVSGSPLAKVVDGEPTGVMNAGGSTVNFQVQRIHTTQDLESALGIDVEASLGIGLFGASARFSYAKEAKIQSSSLFMTVIARVDLKFLSIDAPALTADAASLVDRPDVFAARYGNLFVRGIARGGLFIGVLRIDTTRSEDSEQIAAELQGSYGLFSADAKTKFSSLQSRYHAEVFVQMYHEGGPANLKITDPTNPMELLNNANVFLQSFQDMPQAVAVPYRVTLAPITIARGPLPPNAADIAHAQDVLVYCAQRRSALLDQLNLLQLFLDHPARYSYANGASQQEIAKASADTQSDLDLIARCASAAINSPSSAKMPADFATAHGTTFPKSRMPNLLPTPVRPTPGETPGEPVTIPNWIGWTTTVTLGRPLPDRISQAAAQLHLYVTREYHTREGAVRSYPEADPRRPRIMYVVIGSVPPPGARVPPGTTVRVTLEER